MRSLLIVLSTTLFISCSQPQKPVSIKEDVTVLSSDDFMGRETGTQGEKLAANYIAERFSAIGLVPKGTSGYFQEFTFKASNNPHKEAKFLNIKADSTTTGQNVIGYLDNGAKTTVVIGAHFDHLGMGGEGSLYRDTEKAIHNGADDNASGVAILLKLAEFLTKNEVKQNYLFIAFSGEEKGLLGSNYFTKNPTISLKDVSYMLNMDMVGRLNDERVLAVHGVGTSPVFNQTLYAHNDTLELAIHESGIGPSDHTSFYLMDIPVLHFFTGQHSDYHKPDDDAEKLNYEGMDAILVFIESIVMDLEDNGKLAFRKTKNESENVPAFKVGLGVVPDYLYTGKGMRIDGISEDKPAQKAGLKKGDIVVKMGDSTVVDMMSYMRALSSFKNGDTTTVIIDRDAKEIEVEVTF